MEPTRSLKDKIVLGAIILFGVVWAAAVAFGLIFLYVCRAFASPWSC